MIAQKKRDELLTSWFAKNEEVLVNANDLQKELQHKDDLLRDVKAQNEMIEQLRKQLENAKRKLHIMEIEAPYRYKRFEVKA